MTLLLITDALLAGESKSFALHPALIDFRRQLAAMRRQWFRTPDNNPLGWYAALVDTTPAALLAARCTDLPANARQVWVASPYHAIMGRETVRVLPEVDFLWGEADSTWLCDELNPLLEEDGMSLHVCGAAMLLASHVPLDTAPLSFASISGNVLPNRHPEGVDGGRLMRLLSEIQMSLHNKPQPTRSGQPEVHGLWLWGACEIPSELPVGLPPAATLNPVLQALEHGHGARITITESAHLSDLLASRKLPPAVLLAGAGHAALLHKALMPRFGREWQAGFVAPEADLLVCMRKLADAA